MKIGFMARCRSVERWRGASPNWGTYVSVANSRDPESLAGVARKTDARPVSARQAANKPGITCRQHERRRSKAHPAGFPYRRKAG